MVRGLAKEDVCNGHRWSVEWSEPVLKKTGKSYERLRRHPARLDKTERERLRRSTRGNAGTLNWWPRA